MNQQSEDKPAQGKFFLAIAGANLLVSILALVIIWQTVTAVRPVEAKMTDAIDRLRAASDRTETVSDSLSAIGDELKRWTGRNEQIAGSVKSLDDRVAQIAGETKLLGEILRPRLTAQELRKAVANAEERWLPATRPTAIPSESDELRADVAELELALPQGESAAYASSIRMLAWWADAIELIAATPDDDRTSQGIMEGSQALITTAPVLVPDWAYDALNSVRAREILRIATKRGSDAAATADQLNALEDFLASVRGSLAPNDQALLSQLQREIGDRRAKAENAELVQEFTTLRDEWNRFAARTDLSADLQLEALAITAAQLSQLVIELADAKSPMTNEAANFSETCRKHLADRSKSAYERKRLAYQKWALDQIDKADKLYEKYSGYLYDDEEGYITTLITHLAPINQSELEPSILAHYTKVWNEMMNELKPEEKNRVTKAVSETKQMQLGDV
ncbi:MAG: hypothetical protein FJY39_12750 [Betaproteobacteria bacterium]|nr:hypothetical protein [Betaproteobacteria bacterium]